MHAGLVSTIIPVYNRPTLLLDAVQSVIAQKYRPIEIIIVNDGSTDATVEVARRLEETYSQISVISIPNSGPGLARQAGLDAANGEFIQYLDSDDLLHEDKFSVQVAGLTAMPHCGVSYCRQQYCDMAGNVLDDSWMRSGEEHREMFPAMLKGRIWGTPVPLYRKTLLDIAGPWSNLMNEEDWEYDCRVASHGVSLHYSPQTMTVVRTHNQGHLGLIQDGDLRKLSDRAKAYIAIHSHARAANIDYFNEEMRTFMRICFSHARKCASFNLIEDAESLLQIVNHSSKISKHKRFQIVAFQIVVALLGWKRTGMLSHVIDRWRT